MPMPADPASAELADGASSMPADPASAELADGAASGYGIYVHIPFCSYKCGYCDFASWAGIDDLKERYVSALRAEATRAELGTATSIFVGGGTPSRLGKGQLRRVLELLPRAAGAEVTVEANPESATSAFFEEAVDAGITRISLGMQSSAPHVLSFLDRQHQPASVKAAVRAARTAGVQSLNLDLIFGTPGETPDDWKGSLEDALSLEPEHLSAYGLSVEPGTALGRRVRAGFARHPDEDDCADKYRFAQELLERAGFVQYEISNWARPSHACRHSLLYWGAGFYAGVGCASHSHAPRRRSWNITSPMRYCWAIESGHDAEAGHEILAPEEAVRERLELGLRRLAGVPEALLGGHDLGPAEALVERSDGRVRIRADRLFCANQVLVRLPRVLAVSAGDC
jgi:putative oxygen-independent coproporphyrinogen III oxidase